jgi:hypothetical protein
MATPKAAEPETAQTSTTAAPTTPTSELIEQETEIPSPTEISGVRRIVEKAKAFPDALAEKTKQLVYQLSAKELHKLEKLVEDPAFQLQAIQTY